MLKRNKSTSKNLQSFSTPNLPPAIKNSNILQSPISNQHSNEQQLFQHRKQIQQTLNQLHRLQSQIYELNVPQNPHSSSPVKKQIKQLSYLYQNMTKPKIKNNLNVKSDDIELTMRLMNKDWTPGTKLQPQIIGQRQFNKKGNQIDLVSKSKPSLNNINTSKGGELRSSTKLISKSSNNININTYLDNSYKIPKKVLQQKFEALVQSQFNPNFISKNEKSQYITTKQLYQFINYTECQDFDPIRQAYQMFLNQDGQFDLSIYNSYNQILGLPKIKNINTFIAAITQTNEKNKQIDQKQLQKQYTNNNSSRITAKITFQQFKRVLELQI